MGSSFNEVYWRGMDLLARLFAGVDYEEDLDDSTLPYWTITKESLPTSTEEFPNVENYEEQFKELWGIEVVTRSLPRRHRARRGAAAPGESAGPKQQTGGPR